MQTKSKTTPIFKSLSNTQPVTTAVASALEPIESRMLLSGSLFSAHALLSAQSMSTPSAIEVADTVSLPVTLDRPMAAPFVSVATPVAVELLPAVSTVDVDLLGSNAATTTAGSTTHASVSIAGTFADDLFVDGVCILPGMNDVVIKIQSLGNGGKLGDGSIRSHLPAKIPAIDGDGVSGNIDPVIIILPASPGNASGDGLPSGEVEPTTPTGTTNPEGTTSGGNPTTGTGSTNNGSTSNGTTNSGSTNNGSNTPVVTGGGNTGSNGNSGQHNGSSSGTGTPSNSNTGNSTSGSTGNSGTPSGGSSSAPSGQSDDPVIRPQSPGNGTSPGTGHTGSSSPVVVITPPAGETNGNSDTGSHPTGNLPSRPRGGPASTPLAVPTSAGTQSNRQTTEADTQPGGIETSTTTQFVALSTAGNLVGTVSTPSSVWADTGAMIERVTLAPIGQAVTAAAEANISAVPLGIAKVAGQLGELKDKVVEIGTATRLFQIARLGLPASLLGDSIGAFIGESASYSDQPQAVTHRQRARLVTAAVVAVDVILFASYYRNVTAKRAKEKQKLEVANLVPVRV